MKNLFYSSVFIFFVSLLFVGCTNESEDNTSTEEFKYSSLKNILNTSTIEDELMLEKGSFIVDWNNPMLVEVNKKDFGNDTYMFKAESKGGIYKGENFLPATHWVIAKTKEGKTDLKIHRFEPYANTITPNPSPLQKNGFNGLEFILSNTGKIDDILTYENGEVIASFLEIKKNEVVGSKSAKASSDEFDSCSDINYVCNPDETNNGSGGYQRVTVYVYVAWVNEYYDVHNNFTGYNVQSIKEESYTTWVYVGSSTSPAPIYNYEYRNVSTGGLIRQVSVEDNEADGIWHTACRSFEYEDLGLTGVKVAAVKGIEHPVLRMDRCPGIGYVFPQSTYYFTLPSWKPRAKKESAMALERAFKKLNKYFEDDIPCTPNGQSYIGLLSSKLLEFTKEEFTRIGGTASKYPPSGWNGEVHDYETNIGLTVPDC
ncbi:MULTISPECIES: hypothetical protein [Cellulophaga]|uniref:Lipoprotein n=1 Tax=Cellulophaga geojensis KL-A TaxID=1328323 RepID=A0ABN0RSK8_9FLAO|nr:MULTISPECIES: hypothetical protein [Cellulophaga]AIM61047.1 hypothetical protein IX49_11125 [Cellulophaga lytica]EWH14896.1 hypothetical protein KLA_00015 [Cellulophaga geojensis KL-A]SNQ43652.1 exported hypothetical protein [Cellulophaga lytica]